MGGDKLGRHCLSAGLVLRYHQPRATQPDPAEPRPGLGGILRSLYYTEITFNPVGPTFPGTTRLNPFSVPRIREAVNWLVDRRHVAQEIMGGMGTPRYLVINTVFPDYARMADVARKMEIRFHSVFSDRNPQDLRHVG